MRMTGSPINRHIGARLRLLREKHGLNQAQLGAVLGVTYQQAQKYESGAVRLSAEALFLIARHFDVAANYFFEGLERLRPGMAGFAEAGAGDYAASSAAGEAERLDHAFARIRSRKGRAHAIALVELVAQTFSDDTPA